MLSAIESTVPFTFKMFLIRSVLIDSNVPIDVCIAGTFVGSNGLVGTVGTRVGVVSGGKLSTRGLFNLRMSVFKS